MEPHITVITLGVSDMERAVRFYRDGLSLPLLDPESSVAYFTLSGTWLALYPRDKLADYAGVPMQGSGFSGITLSHNVGSRGDVETVLAKAIEAGATTVKPAGDVSWGGYIAWFADPDGHLWELVWNPKFSKG